MPKPINGVDDLRPGLVLLHANLSESLRDVLLSWLERYPLAPLENEYILVHSNGIAQWLRIAMAAQSQHGIAAALEFMLPASFIWQTYRAVLGTDLVPEASALDKEPLTWRLMQLLPKLIDRPEFQTLSQFLHNDNDMRKRYQLARRLADLYDQYQVYRADWLLAWQDGGFILSNPDKPSQELPAAQQWQARLWQAVIDDLRGSELVLGRAQAHRLFMQAMAAPAGQARPAGLGRRVVIFGISALPWQTLEALAALGRWCQVIICVNNPCQHYWGDWSALALQSGNPLLSSWGRQGRDFISQLESFDDPEQRRLYDRQLSLAQQKIDIFEPLPGTTLLEQLQDDIRDLRSVDESRQKWPVVDVTKDRSVRFYSAYSPQRELESLHDVLLDAFANDPGLSPREVIVMVPDIQEYAAHIHAVFGLYDADDKRYIPYFIADQAQRARNPILIVLEQLLGLPKQRLGIEQLLEWLEVPAVRARFKIQLEDVPAIRQWCVQANIRWGLNAEHREGFELQQKPAEAQKFTWDYGLQRMLLGYASGPQAHSWQQVEPYPNVAGLAAQALGQLAHLLDTLERVRLLLLDNASAAQWASRFIEIIALFFCAADENDKQVLEDFQQAVLDWQQNCAEAGFNDAIPVTVAAEYCLGLLDKSRLSQRFFAGSVSFATLMPMRAIPFRQVYLLGMNDGAFPRSKVPTDFDLMANYPRAGDRSRREDDRYLFLEALLSARERLGIFWVGRDIRDNSVLPPAVLVAQLMDHINSGWLSDDGNDLSTALTVQYPLQPFDHKYFQANNQQLDLFTYASEWFASAQSITYNQAVTTTAAAVKPMQVAVESLQTSAAEVVSIDSLLEFLKHPLKFYVGRQLHTNLTAYDDKLLDTEPYALDGLQNWSLVENIFTHVFRQNKNADKREFYAALDDHLARLQGQGYLVGGTYGQAFISTLKDSLQDCIGAYLHACQTWPLADEQLFEVSSAINLPQVQHQFIASLGSWHKNSQGELARIHLPASKLLSTDNSSKNPHKNSYTLKPALHAWLEHLMVHAHGGKCTTVVISPKGQIVFAPINDQHQARQGWHATWQAWGMGSMQALPIEVDSALRWVQLGASAERKDRAYQAVQDVYASRLRQDMYLQRYYPDFALLAANPLFASLASSMYGQMVQEFSNYSVKAVG